MKSMMARTTLREIKQSLGRYLAIFAIVALGVGFFAGLKITRQVMVKSADNYLKEEQLYDYRLMSVRRKALIFRTLSTRTAKETSMSSRRIPCFRI